MAKENEMPDIDNDGFAGQVAEVVYNKIANTFSDFMDNIKTGQNGIAMDINIIKNKLTKTEEKVTAEEIKIQEHEERLNKKKEDIKEVKEEITTIKSDFEKYKENVRIIAEIKPTLTTLQNFINWWKWWKVALLIIFIIIFFLLLNIVSHSTGIVDIWNDRQGGIEEWGKNLREHQAVDKGTTRAIKTYKMTDKQIDSIQKEIMRAHNIKGI